MVHLFSRFIFFPQWSRAAHCVSTSYSASTTCPHWTPFRNWLLQPCHSGFHLLSHKIWFSWAESFITLVCPLSVLSTCCAGLCVQCWVSCAFFSGVWVSCNCLAVCLQATSGAQALN